ncbi:hypothetical protein [Larsenimonas rhizosphaerae]|uniref:hypothetical protein n=1 Tax=Larsenimonas rhizosphaerae TaxID=2944682 RepID=UPI00203346C2|nr:hypothetical protein [Larsenimonas rhizosphaerae]MCM2131741.1 hypothetical protein [Larsenimonas rhizosphaerae]
MTLPRDEGKRRAFLRGSLTLLPAVVVGSVMAPRVQAASGGGERSEAVDSLARANVLYWGADPSGRRDSSAAFAKAARSQWARTLQVPPGVYRIAQTVDLLGKSMMGPGRTRSGGGDDEACLIPHYDLKGPMFIKTGPEIASLTFNGQSKKSSAVALNCYGYNTTLRNNLFTSLGKAIEVDKGIVNFNILQCAFVACEYGLHVKDKGGMSSTTVRLTGNEFNYVTNCVVFDKELYGATFQDNIFEAVKGDAIVAQVIHGCNFIGNWWEKRNGGKSDWPAVRSTMKQQIIGCFASANTMVYGWKDVFSGDQHNKAMGGVSTNGTAVLVRSSTGSALRMTPGGIKAETDAWQGDTPFIIQGSYASAHKRAHPIVLRHSGHNGDIEFDTDPELTSDGVWKGKLRFAARAKAGAKNDKDKKPAILWDEYQVNENLPGLTGRSPQQTKAGNVHTALTGVPQFVKWRQGDEKAPGVDFFPNNKARKTGQVELSFDQGEYEFRDPILTVTVDDHDVVSAGIDYIDAYSGAGKYKAWRGFVLHFKSLETGKPVTPESFNLQIFHP